jgi:hypothetical protein
VPRPSRGAPTWRASALGALRRRRTAVEIAPGDSTEGLIERIVTRGDEVHVTLLLDDGRHATSRLEPLTADWLGLRTGDIVAVRPQRERGLSG